MPGCLRTILNPDALRDDAARLRKEVGNGDAGRGARQGKLPRVWLQDPNGAIAPAERCRGVADRRSMDLESPIDEVDDPIVRHAGAGVGAARTGPVECQARLRDLHDERRPRGMGLAVVAPTAGYHGEVGLWLGFVMEVDRGADADDPVGAESVPQGLLGEADGGFVWAPLRLGDDQLAGDQLDRLVLVEDAELHEPVVLLPRPTSRARWRSHRSDRNDRLVPRQRPLAGTPGGGSGGQGGGEARSLPPGHVTAAWSCHPRRSGWIITQAAMSPSSPA